MPIEVQLEPAAGASAQSPHETRQVPAHRSWARVALFFAAAIWGSAFVATKLCLGYMGPVDLMALRFAIGVPLLVVILLARRGSLAPVLRSRRWLVGGAILAAHFFIQITGIKHTSATNTGWLITATPLAMALLGWAILRERVAKATLAGIAVATCGIVLLVSRGRLADLGWLSSTGDWLVLASAHTWALYSIATRDLVRSHDPLAVTVAVLLPVTAISVLYFVLSGHATLVAGLPMSAILALVFLSVFGTAVAHWFWQIGIARLGASQAGVFLFCEPLATTAVAVPLLGEPFGLAAGAGAALVVAGVWWAQRKVVSRRLKPSAIADRS